MSTSTPVLTETYAAAFAENLLQTVPGTPEHYEAWDAYLLATAVAADDALGSPSADQLNGAYLSRLSEVAGHLGTAAVIPPITWSLDEWRRQVRIVCSLIDVPRGERVGDWSDALAKLIAGEITISDPRPLHQRGAAFLRAA